MVRSIVSTGVLCVLFACSSEDHTVDPKLRSALQPDAGAGAPALEHEAGVAAYPGVGFIVHEWGTNTVVVGSDGTLQRGMHHEEEDLPAFVYDRLGQGEFLSFPSIDKMETPVDYFYADRPLTARVSVAMPNGLLTQWYPAVHEFAPSILDGAFGRTGKVDPHLELGLAFTSPQCVAKYTAVAGGSLDWGEVEILPRGTEGTLPDAPLDRFTWSHAREVAANTVRVKNPPAHTGQDERFLFYRGLGNFPLPVEVSEASEGIKLINRSPWPTQGSFFVLDVGAETAAFRVSAGALLPEAERLAAFPELADRLPLDQFVAALEAALTTALLQSGLYHDEAVAMVRTWRRQWFRTPGLRVLHLAPAAWIDREVPIAITPAPDALLRVMVLRIELLRRTIEEEDLRFAAKLDGGAQHAAAEAYFRARGRFAEPRLRRALDSLPAVPPAAVGFLSALEQPRATSGFGG
jgi:hypothetical protein